MCEQEILNVVDLIVAVVTCLIRLLNGFSVNISEKAELQEETEMC